jgi:hypothetical protein
MAPLQEFEPEYVPVTIDPDTCPSPEMLAVHDANGLSKPPAEIFTEKWIDEPDVVPDTEPRALIPVAVSVTVAVPENDVSVCVSCQEIAPGPDESEA